MIRGRKRLLCDEQISWVDFAVADLVDIFVLLDSKARDYNNQLQVFAKSIF